MKFLISQKEKAVLQQTTKTFLIYLLLYISNIALTKLIIAIAFFDLYRAMCEGK